MTGQGLALSKLFVAALTVGSIFATSVHLRSQAAEDRQVAERLWHETQAAYHRARDAHEAFRIYGERFAALKQSGLIDGDPRLAWIDAVESNAAAAGLSSLQFELQPASPYSLLYPRVAAAVTTSAMTLHFQLDHEGQLLEFLHRLHDSAPALFWSRACDLERSETQPASPGTDKIRARCELLWFTVHTDPGAEPSP